MSNASWAIVLAAGEGSRLSALTRTRDGLIPKQFCSLDGGPTLFSSALERASSVVGEDRVVPIVAAQHRGLWAPELRGFPRQNVVVQPRNRGTAAGILLPLLHVLDRDPQARVAVLPSDHFVAQEWTLRACLAESLDRLSEAEKRGHLAGNLAGRANFGLRLDSAQGSPEPPPPCRALCRKARAVGCRRAPGARRSVEQLSSRFPW